MTSIGEAIASSPVQRDWQGHEHPFDTSDLRVTETGDSVNDELSALPPDEDLTDGPLRAPAPSRVRCRSSRPRPRWRERRRARERARERQRERASVDDDVSTPVYAAGALNCNSADIRGRAGGLSATQVRR